MRSLIRIAGMSCASFLVVSFSGCAASMVAAPPLPVTKAEPAPVPAPLPDPVGEEIPLQRGVIPDGWEPQGPFGMGIVFAKNGTDAQVAFTVLQTGGFVTAKEIVDRLVATNASKPGVRLYAVSVSADGQEASLRIEDRRIGVKFGKVVVRCFPGRTVYAVMTSGLWPEAIDAQSLQDFETFLKWVRLE